jgi:hypothetical protein
MTSSGGVPRSSVMMENWSTSEEVCQHSVYLSMRGIPSRQSSWTHNPCPGIMACTLASRQKCTQCSRCPLPVCQRRRLWDGATAGLTSDIVLLPTQKDLGRSIVPRRRVARHLRVVDSCQPEVADLPRGQFLHFTAADKSGSPESTLRSQFSLTRMLDGLRSRCTTPAEWTYLNPRRIW